MKTALRAVGSLAVLAAASGCQVYDFEPVTPLAIAQTTQTKNVTAKQLKPNLMVLLDKSGSMAQPLTPAGCACSFGTCNETTCPTRMGAARRALDNFLMNNGTVARMGLTVFPADNQCTAAGSGQQLVPINPMSDSDTDLQSWANSINTQIQAQCTGNPLPPTCPLGGTPTAGSLSFLGTLNELKADDREDFILLLTDGLPNCNSNNPNTCANQASCKCTLLNAMGMPSCAPGNNDAFFCVRGCLDEDGAVQAIRNLRMLPGGGVRTIVVGFGSDFVTSGDGFNVLNAMAIAGGFQRTCPMGTDAECGTGGRCVTSTNTCEAAFYSATNQTELVAALAAISASLGADTVCKYTLSATPSSADLVSVIIDGVPVPSGPDTWNLTTGQIIFPNTGPQSTCKKLLDATPTAPIKLEIRIVQSL